MGPSIIANATFLGESKFYSLIYASNIRTQNNVCFAKTKESVPLYKIIKDEHMKHEKINLHPSLLLAGSSLHTICLIFRNSLTFNFTEAMNLKSHHQVSWCYTF